MTPTPLVTTDWLLDHLEDVVPVDASWHLPGADRNGPAEFDEAHIAGALFFDIDAISKPDTGLPHTLPSARQFADAVSNLGIKNTDTLVIYDHSDVCSAARVWWMFRHFGHNKVFVLDGGLEKWLAEGKPTTAEVQKRISTYTVDYSYDGRFCAYNTVLETTETRQAQILDARAKARFEGTAPEPRPGQRSGHIPGSMNLPFVEVLTPDKTFKSTAELEQTFRDAGVDLDAPVIASCGSGITACVLGLAMELLGKENVTVYDGSWTEWGSRDDLPIETGPAK